MTSLMERSNSGLYVELVYLGDNKVAIKVKDGDKEEIFIEIPPEKALDAFHHPFAYHDNSEKI